MARAVPTARQETKTILAISMPLMAAYVAEMGMMITDMVIVGRLGANELAAVGLSGDWFYVLLLIGMGVVSIVGVMVAQSYGEEDWSGVSDAAEQGLIVATICSLPVILAVWYLAPALSFTGQDADVIRLIADYSQPLAFSVVPALWFVTLRNYVTALEKASPIMTITVVALLLNAAINYTLVFGKFGFPAYGVAGAAYGTVIVTWLMFAVLAWYVHFSSEFSGCRPRLVPLAYQAARIKEIFKLGLPITATQLLNGAMFTVAAIMVGAFGADVLAAQMIVYSVIYFCLSASLGFADAIRVRVAYGIGIRSIEAVRQSTRISVLLAAALIVVATLVLWIFPTQLVGIFLDTSDVANAAVLTLAISLSVYGGLFQLLDGVLIVLANGLRGMRDTTAPFWISMAGYWVIGLGGGGWLCFVMDYGVVGLWWGLIGGAAGAIVLTAFRLRTQLRKIGVRLESA